MIITLTKKPTRSEKEANKMMGTGTFKCTKCGERIPREFVNLHVCKEGKRPDILMDYVEGLMEEAIDQSLKRATP
jgi:hypothetical protein